MDYEKKYKEALEKARKLHNGLCSCGVQVVTKDIEAIFPELAESEDEEIRKWIRKVLEEKYVIDGTVSSNFADKAFAWLEKQKPVEWSDDDNWNMQIFMNALDLYKEPVDKQMLKSWFKSLRSQKRWKPTEVQLTSLYDTIVQTKGQACSVYLSELYKQLKEL